MKLNLKNGLQKIIFNIQNVYQYWLIDSIEHITQNKEFIN